MADRSPLDGWAVGIDLGTANTRVAVFRRGGLETIPEKGTGRVLFPSFVAFAGYTGVFYGSAARDCGRSDPGNTVYGFKRFLGTGPQPPGEEWHRLQDATICENFSFAGARATFSPVVDHFRGFRDDYTAVELYAMLLRFSRLTAEAYLGAAVTRAHVTVPACFTAVQREEVQAAATSAGFIRCHLVGTIDAVAASVALKDFRPWETQERIVAFLDLGACYCNTGIARIHRGSVRILAVDSRPDLGASSYADRLENWLVGKIWMKWPGFGPGNRARVRAAVKTAIKQLGTNDGVDIDIQPLFNDAYLVDGIVTLYRYEFDALCADLLDGSVDSLVRSLGATRLVSGLLKADVTEIIFTGGGSRMPGLRDMWLEYFDNTIPLSFCARSSESQGAALSAAAAETIGTLQHIQVSTLTPVSIHIAKPGYPDCDNIATILARGTELALQRTSDFVLGDLGVSSAQPFVQIYDGEGPNVPSNRHMGALDLRKLRLGDRLNVKLTVVRITARWEPDGQPTITAQDPFTRSTTSFVRCLMANDLTLAHILSYSMRQDQTMLGNQTDARFREAMAAWTTDAEREAKREEAKRNSERVAERFEARYAMEESLLKVRRQQAQLPGRIAITTRAKVLGKLLEAMSKWAEQNRGASVDEYREKVRQMEMLSHELRLAEESAPVLKRLLSQVRQLRERVASLKMTAWTALLSEGVSGIAGWLDQNYSAELKEYEIQERRLESLSDRLDDYLAEEEEEELEVPLVTQHVPAPVVPPTPASPEDKLPHTRKAEAPATIRTPDPDEGSFSSTEATVLPPGAWKDRTSDSAPAAATAHFSTNQVPVRNIPKTPPEEEGHHPQPRPPSPITVLHASPSPEPRNDAKPSAPSAEEAAAMEAEEAPANNPAGGGLTGAGRPGHDAPTVMRIPNDDPPSKEPLPGPSVAVSIPDFDGIGRLFPDPDMDSEEPPQREYTDVEFEEISTYLRNTGHTRWSKVPRIYTVLRLVGQVEAIDSFLSKEMNDIWFPFSNNTLPKVLVQPHRSQFLNTQHVVFSKALKLERGSKLDDKGENRRHSHFRHGEPLPFVVRAHLGHGAHGSVDKVMSLTSNQEFVRKLFVRPHDRSKNESKTFINELKILKEISHRHCIELIGSYSDPRYFALIMRPVADCNLEKYYDLALKDPDRKSLMRGFFGCLAGTLDYLHTNKVVHQDIKPQNILVRADEVLLTDFGIARSWEGLSRATTTADQGLTWVYASPEVARGGAKNESADVWSLGCVFLEMCTVLNGVSVRKMRVFFKDRSDSACFYQNVGKDDDNVLQAWMEELRRQQMRARRRASTSSTTAASTSNPASDNNQQRHHRNHHNQHHVYDDGEDDESDDCVPLEWIADMLQVLPARRTKPFELFDKTVAESQRGSQSFCATCCFRSPGQAGSVADSDESMGRSTDDELEDEDL